MCGIVGKINLNEKDVNKKEMIRMLNVIKHRGPDGQRVFIDRNIGLGHVLLKIQDLSGNSIQPFEYDNYVITYNGEIYNYQNLKEELMKSKYTFSTCGDTEVLIKYIHCYGLKNTLEKVEGCYAFALFDKKSRETYLVRDKMGIKPLYVYKNDETVIFASEIKSIIQDESVERKFDIETAIISFNCKLWMDPTKTLFSNIYMLEPGHYIKISGNKIQKNCYYKLKFTQEYSDIEKILEDFSKEFTYSVKQKLISKVPVAAFLSGGLDSSIVCKLLNDNIHKPIDTYTIFYNKDDNIDMNFAIELCEKEKMKNHNVLISEEMYNIDTIDKVIYHVEEILIDKVYVSMYYNYKKAKEDGYRVVVSGQGSDEVWLGYIFNWGIFNYINEKANIETLINDYYIKNMAFLEKLKPRIREKVYVTMRNYLNRNLNLNNNDVLNSYSELSIKTILQDLLMQEDKIAMASNVESRVPFVDNHRIVELAYKISSKYKIYDGREKYIVRKFADKKIPNSIVERKKYPFPEPPEFYNIKISNILKENWKEVKNSKILNKLIDFSKVNDIDDFSPVEQWMLLSYWRFEKVFKMEV